MLTPGYTHIVCAVGTGTTITGIINGTITTQKVIGISALKVKNANDNELLDFIKRYALHDNYKIIFDYHFGGMRGKTNELISFMNELYLKESIPSDFVYTGKLFYGVYDLTRKGTFSHGSKILIIHSGGLQGNRSLVKGELVF